MVYYSDNCMERKYKSKWTADQCWAFLEAKNIYDTLIYKLEKDEHCIIFYSAQNKTLGIPGGNFFSHYAIGIDDYEEGAVIQIECMRRGISFPISYNLLDDFFQSKLDALPLK